MEESAFLSEECKEYTLNSKAGSGGEFHIGTGGWWGEYTAPALDFKIDFPLGDLPISTASPTCRNSSSFLNKTVARSPSGDFLCIQPWRVRLLFHEAAAGFLIERELKI